MAVFVEDTFTDTNGTNLQSHTGETGATWTKLTGFSRDSQIQSNRLENLTNTDAAYYASGAPGGADYDVELDYNWINSQLATCEVLGRVNTSNGDFYSFYYRRTSNEYRLRKRVSSTYTTLASTSGGNPASGVVLNHRLSLSGTSLVGYVDDVSTLSTTDSDITAAGKAGLSFSSVGSTAPRVQVDNFLAADASGGSATISPADTAHSHVGDQISLTQVHALGVHDATSAHTADAVTLAQNSQIIVVDGTHAHAADAVNLAQGGVLVIADGIHPHGALSPALAQNHVLAVLAALHAQAAGQVFLTLEGVLPPAARRLRVTDRNRILAADGSLTVSASQRRQLQPE